MKTKKLTRPRKLNLERERYPPSSLVVVWLRRIHRWALFGFLQVRIFWRPGPAPTPKRRRFRTEPRPELQWHLEFRRLIKTIASISESTIQNYRQELEEFGSGLKKETAVIREVASRAVKDLPGSLDVGASVAQESLESVGQAIDDIDASVWKLTAEIISPSGSLSLDSVF